MDDITFGAELLGKEVVTIKGRTVGVLEDIVIDTDDGLIKYLLVSAKGKITGEPHKVDENGRLVVETDRIRVEGNRLVIN